MADSQYLSCVTQTNGCRVWTNPLEGTEFPIPSQSNEIYIRNIPKEHTESDLLPLFERFGPVYQLRLLVEVSASKFEDFIKSSQLNLQIVIQYDSGNRGFGYLLYYWEKSVIECLEVMPFFFINTGSALDVEISQDRRHLSVINIPTSIQDNEIEIQIKKMFVDATHVSVHRGQTPNRHTNALDKQKNCSAIVKFRDHSEAVAAKRWSGLGSLNLWGRSIKVLWARQEEIADLLETPMSTPKHLLAHNMDEFFDPEVFGSMMCKFVKPHEIVSIRPMKNDWLVEFTKTEAALKVHMNFNSRVISGQQIETEIVNEERLKRVATFADFDYELRCLCLANFYDPPVVIYGKVFQSSQIQMASVIIKNNRNNRFVTFLIEITYEDLIDIHARVCEAVFWYIFNIKELPKKNVVMKVSRSFLFLSKYIDLH